MLCLIFAGCTAHFALVRFFVTEVVKKLFVNLDWKIGFFGLPFYVKSITS